MYYTFQILTEDTNRIIFRSAVSSANASGPDRNLRLDPHGGDTHKPSIQSFTDVSDNPNVTRVQSFKPEELLEMYKKDGQQFQAHVSAKITELGENNNEKI